MEIGYSDAGRQSLLPFEIFVQALPKVWLNTQSLQDKDAHANEPLFCWVMPLVHCVEKEKNHEVVRPIRVNDKRSEPFIALQSLPEEHDHFRSPCE